MIGPAGGGIYGKNTRFLESFENIRSSRRVFLIANTLLLKGIVQNGRGALIYYISRMTERAETNDNPKILNLYLAETQEMIN